MRRHYPQSHTLWSSVSVITLAKNPGTASRSEELSAHTRARALVGVCVFSPQKSVTGRMWNSSPTASATTRSVIGVLVPPRLSPTCLISLLSRLPDTYSRAVYMDIQGLCVLIYRAVHPDIPGLCCRCSRAVHTGYSRVEPHHTGSYITKNLFVRRAWAS